MVDAATAAPADAGTASHAPPAASFTAAVRTGAAALDLYAALCDKSEAAPAQSAGWLRAWNRSAAPDLVLVFLELAGHAVFALALEITGSGVFRTARFPGGRHANGNFPAATPQFMSEAAPEHFHALAAAIRQARPDIDLIALERQAPARGGFANPLLALPHRRSTNLALAADLGGGFEALLERASGKRKRKKHRSQIRKFEAAGGYRRFQAETPAEAERLLAAFLDMKGKRFRRQGVADAFGDPKVRNFLRDLFASALADPRPRFLLHGLEVGGILRAVSGSSVGPDRMTCEFAAIAEDELTSASPGEFLFFENIREACERGFAVYDFSVGDEPYKRQWCDIETWQFDTILPLTAKGQVLAAADKAASAAKRWVKNSPAMWAVAKRLRSRVGAEASAA